MFRNKSFAAIKAVFIIAAASVFFVSGCGSSADKQNEKEAASLPSSEENDDNSDKETEDTGTYIDTDINTDTDADAPADTKTSANDNAWAEAYYDYLTDFDRNTKDSGYDGLEYRSFDYIYVNDDDIPELVLQGQDEATGNLILTYNDGVIDGLQTGRLHFDYIERGNLLRNSDGNMGVYYDYVYSIEDGKWKMVEQGEYHVDDNTEMWDDDDLIYEWNGKQMSASEYKQELHNVYDADKAKPGVAVLESREILDRLRNDASGKDSGFLEDDTAIHRYEVIVDDVTWEEAMEDCRARGGYLVRMNTAEEKYHIEDMLRENGQEKLVLWLGGCLNPEDGHYHWYDGEKYTQAALDEDKYYQFFWLNGEPSFTGEDADGNTVSENYMCMFMVQEMWEWNDVPDDISPYYKGRIAYICEYEDTP